MCYDLNRLSELAAMPCKHILVVRATSEHGRPCLLGIVQYRRPMRMSTVEMLIPNVRLEVLPMIWATAYMALKANCRPLIEYTSTDLV